MLYLIISITGILVTIFFVIGTHEYAHFKVARLLNIKVLRFSIGFGKTLWHGYDKKGTEYVIALVPLGGYVKMLDETEGSVRPEELHLAFNRQPFYKKFLVVLAGPFANIFCAFILYWLIFIIGFTTVRPIIDIIPHSIAAKSGLQQGQEIVAIDKTPTKTWNSILFGIIAHVGDKDSLYIEAKTNDQKNSNTYKLDLTKWQLDDLSPDPLMSLGIKPYAPPLPLVIGVITENSPASHSGLRLGDEIRAINKKSVSTWAVFLSTIQAKPNHPVILTVKRKNNTLNIPVTIGDKRTFFFQKSGYLGIGPSFVWPKAWLRQVKLSPLAAISEAWSEVVNFTYFNFLLFGKLITGKLSLQSLGGPITIFETAGEALNSGFLAFFAFLAFLSVAIGVINLLPIPGLDGGHILIQIIELMMRRPLPEKILMMFYTIGLLFILSLLFVAVLNDLMRINF